jgi:hypothetical protein
MPTRRFARVLAFAAVIALAPFLSRPLGGPSLLHAQTIAAPARQALAKGPYVTDVTDRTATVRFELASPAPAALDVTTVSTPIGARPDAGAGASKSLHVESPDPGAMHVVRVAGLEPATRYGYVVKVAGKPVADGHFETAPAPDSDAPQTFIVYGDERTDDAAHAAVVRAIGDTPADFLVNTGDMVADGGKASDWQTFFDIERPLLHERALFVAIGNHELYDDAAGQNFARYFGFPDAGGAPQPYGTVRVGRTRLFFLNGMHDWASGPERTWLEHALADADVEPGLAWRFAVVHHGPWSSGPHGPNTLLQGAHIPELLAAHKVDLVFSGHDHIYERGDAGLLKYVISGGGGAPVYRDIHPTPTTRTAEATHHFVEVTLQGDALQLVAHRVDGSLLEKCGFTRGHPWDCDPPPAAHASVAPAGSTDGGGSGALAGGAGASAPGARGCACSAIGQSPASDPSPPAATGTRLAVAAALLLALRRRGSGTWLIRGGPRR